MQGLIPTQRLKEQSGGVHTERKECSGMPQAGHQPSGNQDQAEDEQLPKQDRRHHDHGDLGREAIDCDRNCLKTSADGGELTMKTVDIIHHA